MLGGRLGTDSPTSRLIQIDLLGQLPIRQPVLEPRYFENALLDTELLRIDLQRVCRRLCEQVTNFCAGLAHGLATFLDGAAARGGAFVGAARGVHRMNINAGVIDIEFFGRHLRDGRKNALTQLHLAGQEAHPSRCLEAYPAVEPG